MKEMNPLLAQKAIKAALTGNWSEAKSLNQEILKENPRDIDALNRLAHAEEELGAKTAAIKTYKKVLAHDPYNKIAQRALGRLEKPGRLQKKKGEKGVETTFIEEPGKTRTVSLIHLGADQVLSNLDAGQSVQLVSRSRRVSVQTEEGKYIGRLPDDLSRRIINLARAGNEYKALVRSVTDNQVKVFIKEVKRAPQLSDIPTFPQTEKAEYISFTPPELVHEEKPETASLEEEEEG